MLKLPTENTLDREEKIMVEWIDILLSDILMDKGYIRGPFGSALKRGDMKEDGIPVYEQQHAIYNSRDFRYYIDEQKFNEMKRFQVKKDDLIISCSGTVGKVSIIKDDDPKGIISQALLLLRADTNKVLPLYLKYFFSSREGYNAIVSRSSGSVQVNIAKRSVIEQIPLKLPQIKTQRKIVGVLSSIDEKIEENERINNNLEQQAQAIFSNEFLTLETPPDGWKQASLIDIADYLNGLAMQKYRPTANETGIRVLKIKELRQGCCDDNSELCSPSIKSEYIIHDGDVIFSWSGSLLVDFWCGGICGLNQHLFKVTSNKYDKWFYYAWTKHHLDRFIAIAADKATTMGHIKRDELSKAEVLIPNKADFKRIGALLQPIYDLIIANRIENKKLTETKDTLLPKLMSGEIDISEVDYE